MIAALRRTRETTSGEVKGSLEGRGKSTGRMEQEGRTDDDAVPDVPEEPTAKRGDLYVLGEHRLLCGDATKAEDVERLGVVGSEVLITDPPYGINRDPGWLDHVGTHRQASREVLAGHAGNLDLSMLWPVKRRLVVGVPYIPAGGAVALLGWAK